MKTMLKRLSAVFLAILLLLTHCAAFAEGAQGETTTEETPVLEELVVANPTVVRGEWFTEMWGNSTTDIDVRILIHGYNLVMWESALGTFKPDPMVVRKVITHDLEDGSRTYTFYLKTDLKYSDGSKITAWDYAFSQLFVVAPEIYDCGGTPVHEDYLVGYDQYVSGELSYFPGVRVLNDYTLQFTVQDEYVPFFYEYGLFYCTPFPIKEIAPGVVVKDDGDGVSLANEDETITEPIFTADLIKKTVLDPETGYASHPKVVSGPYTVVSFEGDTGVFEINPYFKGDENHHSVLPTIKRLIFTLADNNDMIEKLESGEIGLLNKVTKKDTIEKGLKLCAGGAFQAQEYPRVGLSFISFFTEKNTVASKAVRQAIGYCVDRQVLTDEYCGEYGEVMETWQGLAHWTYRIMHGIIPWPIEEPKDPEDPEQVEKYNKERAEWEGLSMDKVRKYTLNVEKAIDILEKDGWTLNREGAEFDPEKDDVRCKEINGELVALDLKLWYPAGNKMQEIMEENFVPNLAKAGIKLTMEGLPMVDILSTWYDQGERDGDMVYLATNFDVVYDPAVNFVEDEGGLHTWNYTNLYDEKLYDLAIDMRTTPPYDLIGYMKKFIDFSEEFMEELPILPIYSNMYFDFFTSDLHNYSAPSNVTWTQAIVPSTLGSTAEAAPAK